MQDCFNAHKIIRYHHNYLDTPIMKYAVILVEFNIAAVVVYGVDEVVSFGDLY